MTSTSSSVSDRGARMTSKQDGQDLREKLSLWESSLATLSDRQKDGVMTLSTLANSRPMPKDLPVDDPLCEWQREGGAGRATRTVSNSNQEGQPSGDAISDSVWSQLVASTGGRISSVQQLHTWLDKMDAAMEEDQVRNYKVFADQLKEYSAKCDSLLSEIGAALSCLQEVKQKHAFVASKTGALHQACQNLMDEQTKLMVVADSIRTKLAYFNEFDRMGQRLSLPTLSVTSESFVPLLKKLDECVSFMQDHPHYKESQVYLARFQQFQSRALNLVKNHITTTIRSTTQSMLQPAQHGAGQTLGGRGTEESAYSLNYGKFKSSAPKVKILVKEIEQRASKSPEYQLLLEDCHQCYLAQRAHLVLSTVTTTLQRIEREGSHNLCGVVRGGCGYLCRVCMDEHQLFYCFFTERSSRLNGFLESLCYSLYDILRPLIIKVIHLETLAELCNIVKGEILEDQIAARKDELSATSPVFEGLLEDIQQRLVYRAQKYILSDIASYAHSPGDLAYPDKLIVAREATSHLAQTDTDSVFEASASESEGESAGSKARPPKSPTHAPVDHQAMWYPTVRRTLLCLSKLYRCVERPTFEGLAQEALRGGVFSLQTAASLIGARKIHQDMLHPAVCPAKSSETPVLEADETFVSLFPLLAAHFTLQSKVDGQLFLIKHLLILREQIVPFDVSFTVRETHLDFTKTKAAAYDLLKKKSRLFSFGSNNAFLEFFLQGAPELTEHFTDSKKEVDLKLKTACEEFILHVTNLLCAPLTAFLGKVEVLRGFASKEGKELAGMVTKQPFAEAKAIHDVVGEASRLLQHHVPSLWSSMALYLANEETEYILFKPVKVSVLRSFDALYQLVSTCYSEEDQQIIACPLQEQVSIMLARQ